MSTVFFRRELHTEGKDIRKFYFPPLLCYNKDAFLFTGRKNMAKTGKGDFAEKKMIESAKALFYEQGVSKTTVAQITNKAGVNNGLFTYYFGTKASLAAMIDNQFRLTLRNMVSQALFDMNKSYDLALGIATEYRVTIDLYERHPKLRRFSLETYRELQNHRDNSYTDILAQKASFTDSQRGHFYQMQRRLINPDISDIDLQIYQVVGIAATNSLLEAWHDRVIDCSKEYLGDRFIDICFGLLGMKEEEMERCRRASLEAEKHIKLSLAPYFELSLKQ